MRKRILAAGLVAALLAGAAYAQSIPVPVTTQLNQNDLVQVVPRGVPSAQSVFATPGVVSHAPSYVKVSPNQAVSTAGYFNTFAPGQTYLILVLGSTFAYSYAAAESAPSDGARECIVGSGGAITAAYLTAATGQTVTGGSNVSIAANAAACWTYSASNMTWDRS